MNEAGRKPGLVFLKLGGSLITDKTRPHTLRPEILARLADEIAFAYQENPQLSLVLGHGSGSYGHVPARLFGTRQGVRSPQEWRGFAQVWHAAAQLNHLVINALISAGLPVIAFPPSAGVVAESGRISTWNLAPVRAALDAGLIPVIFGDTVFDRQLGGTILSTEDLLFYLALSFQPQRILLAGLEPGVWEDFPDCTHLVQQISRLNLHQFLPGIQGSPAPDVTGGMESKVLQSLDLVNSLKGLQIFIFSGQLPGAVAKALAGEWVGTCIQSG